MAEELTEQAVPEVPVYCPECGGEPSQDTDELRVQHSLANMGYLHDDQTLECSECGNRWTHGVPVGEFDGGQDLVCDSCQHDETLEGAQYYRVHRVVPSREASPGGAGIVTLHLKCPRCYLFKKVKREMDHRGIALVGFPPITGSMTGAQEYGWTGTPPGVGGED